MQAWNTKWFDEMGKNSTVRDLHLALIHAIYISFNIRFSFDPIRQAITSISYNTKIEYYKWLRANDLETYGRLYPRKTRLSLLQIYQFHAWADICTPSAALLALPPNYSACHWLRDYRRLMWEDVHSLSVDARHPFREQQCRFSPAVD